MWKFHLGWRNRIFDFEQKPITDTVEKAQSALKVLQCFPFWCQFVSLLLIWHSASMLILIAILILLKAGKVSVTVCLVLFCHTNMLSACQKSKWFEQM